MKKILLVFILYLVIAGCNPKVNIIPTPTITSFPTMSSTSTPTQTKTQSPTLTITPTINTEATSTVIESKQKFFTDETKRVFADFGCVVAVWGENSFEFACTDIGTNDIEKMKRAAYSLTLILAQQLDELELRMAFEDNFILSIALLSSDTETALITKTPGITLSQLIEDPKMEFEEWLTETEIEFSYTTD